MIIRKGEDKESTAEIRPKETKGDKRFHEVNFAVTDVNFTR